MVDFSILSAAETVLRTIRIKTPTSFLEKGRFDIFSVHDSFAGKNSGLSQSATEHFCPFPHSIIQKVHHSDAFYPNSGII